MKSKLVVYHPDARVEALEAFIWYEEHEAGLGERFQRALAAAEEFISANWLLELHLITARANGASKISLTR